MVLEKPKEKKLAKIETLKIGSNHLKDPLLEVCCLLASKELLLAFRIRSDDFNLSPSDR
jgi:hypothetical protein